MARANYMLFIALESPFMKRVPAPRSTYINKLTWVVASVLCLGAIACNSIDGRNAVETQRAVSTPSPVSVPGVLTLIAGSLDGPGAKDGDRLAAQFGDGLTKYGIRHTGITSDASGNVYVADVSNHTIRKISPLGIVSTVAGKAGQPGNTDGVGSDARFNYPSGIAVDAEGTLYVADAINGTIRKISPVGEVTTLATINQAYPNAYGKVREIDFPIVLDWYTPSASYDVTVAEKRSQTLMAITVDAKGNVYGVGAFNRILFKVSPMGEVYILSGRDGSDTATWLNLPKGIVVDQDGVLYIANCGDHTIRKLTPTGDLTIFAGKTGQNEFADGESAAARFNCPIGIVVDKSGNLYVADEGNNAIRTISPKGVVTTLAGDQRKHFGHADGTGAAATFHSPSGVTLSSEGDLYVADSRNALIRKINSAGAVTTVAGQVRQGGSIGGVGAAARFNQPFDLATDKLGNLYVADTRNSVIRKIGPTGIVTTVAGTAGAHGSSDEIGAATRQFFAPMGITADAAGNLYVTNPDIHVIRKITPAGVVSTLAGLAGKAGHIDGAGLLARFDSPFRITSDQAGNLYVSDNYTIRKIDSAGVVTTIAGSPMEIRSEDGAGQNARFAGPSGLVHDAAGNLYVADGRTIRKISQKGAVTTFAGRANKAGSADGVGSNALFNSLGALVMDAEGNLYVCDAGNATIRKITPEGIVTTVAGDAHQRGVALGSPGILDDPKGLALLGPKTLALTTGNAVLKLTIP